MKEKSPRDAEKSSVDRETCAWFSVTVQVEINSNLISLQFYLKTIYTTFAPRGRIVTVTLGPVDVCISVLDTFHQHLHL